MRGRSGLLRSLLTAAAMGAALIASAPGVAAETLFDALAKAYQQNPALRAERARQRATDELVPQALSGWRPTVTAQGQVEASDTHTKTAVGVVKDHVVTPSVSIQLSQPLFRGFRTVNGVKQAEASVDAGRQDLLVQELSTLFNTVQAYMGVIRDREILALRQRDVTFLQEQLRAANQRFEVGEITRTDVAQARSSLAQSRGAVASARANLTSSIATYLRFVGKPPGKLAYPRVAPLPKSLDAAQAVASDINPNILSAAYNEIAATYNIEVVRGQLLPELSLQATASAVENPSESTDRSRSASIAGVLTVPIYEGGLVYSQVREAKQLASQRRLLVIETGRGVREAVSNAWANYLASTQLISANRTQVEAARLALEGVQQEYLVGSRTTLDVLNAQSALITSRLALVQAQSDQIVASYDVLASIGRLTARHLRLRTPYYDVKENYRAVRNKWIGTGVKTVD
jgi:outer membrane protein